MTTSCSAPAKGYETALIQWLYDPALNVIATPTLKQGRPIGHGSGRWEPITPDAVRRTAWLIRDRVSRKVFGRRFKHHPFLTFHHGGDDKRHHLHIVACCPSDMSIDEYAAIFRQVSERFVWVHERADFRLIKAGTAQTVIKYGLGGTDSVGAQFLPEASFVPAQ